MEHRKIHEFALKIDATSRNSKNSFSQSQVLGLNIMQSIDCNAS